MPFTAPPARSWVRCRSLWPPTRRQRKPDAGPEWRGAWHLFSGDTERGDERGHDVFGRSLCGQRLHLRGHTLSDDGGLRWDHVAVDDMPSVDTCGRCRRYVERPA
jgi:hypothetical protein